MVYEMYSGGWRSEAISYMKVLLHQYMGILFILNVIKS